MNCSRHLLFQVHVLSLPLPCSTYVSIYQNLTLTHYRKLSTYKELQNICILYYCFSILYHALVLLTQNQEDILKSGEMISKTRYAKNNFSDRNEKMFARKGCSASLMSMIELSPGMTRIFHPLLVSFSSPSLFQREVLFRKVLRPWWATMRRVGQMSHKTIMRNFETRNLMQKSFIIPKES